MRLRCAGRKAYEMVRNCFLPLPSLQSLYRWFKFVHVEEGLIRATHEFFKLRSPFMEERERYSALCFDELSIKNVGNIDRILDMQVGPAKNANVVMIRSLVADWKYPIYLMYDSDFLEPDLATVTQAMKEVNLKLKVITCDQGGKNYQFPNSQNISTENTSFKNPSGMISFFT